MLIHSKIIRNIFKSNFRKYSSLECCPIRRHLKLLSNSVLLHRNEFHTSSKFMIKMFMEKENKYAYEVMEKNGYATQLNITNNSTIITKEQFDHLLTKDWLKESTQEIFQTFPLIASYIFQHNICISNTIFDNFIDALTDNIQHSTNDQLKSHFFTLAKCPETASIRTRNYVEIWAALDDACLNRYKEWSYDEMLSFVTLFYMLNATKASDYCYKCVQKLTYKANKLTRPQLVQTLFFIGAMRFAPHDMHNLELAVDNKFNEFCIDELAIISMGFFKSKVPIRSMDTVSKIIDIILNNPSTIKEISLAALLKCIRFSRKIPIDDKVYRLLDILQHEVPRLSIMCNVHIALLASSSLTLHEGCFLNIANTVLKNMSGTRLKDLERLVLTFGTFNMVPQTQENFIENVIDELRKPEREQEIQNHGRSFACCVAYLGLLGTYPIDLMQRVFVKEFLENAYGKYCLSYGREVLTLHNLVKIFHKDTCLEYLNEKQALTLAKKYTDFLPDENYPKQYNITEKMYLDVKKVIQEDRGGSQYVTGQHILTHHQRGDLIICDSKENGPVEVENTFKDIKFGTLCPAPSDDNIWIALIIAGRNAMIYNSNKPSGNFLSKIRELNALGYRAAPVCWTIYTKCKTYEEKRKYINLIINEAKSSYNIM